MPKFIPLLFTACATLQSETGFFMCNVPSRLATEGFYLAEVGSSLELKDSRYRFAVATYSLEFPEKYLHTYDYAPEQIWGTYRGDLREDSYCMDKYIFKGRCYFRVAARRADGENITAEEAAGFSSTLIFTSTVEKRQSCVFEQEVERVGNRINTLREPGDLALVILADTHMTVNGTWQDTAANLLALQQKTRLDGLVHLGDLTDGTVSRWLTCRYVQSMLKDMHKLEVPVHIVLGNHDANYFHGNPDVMSLHEQAALYHEGAEKWKQDRDKTYYYVDCPQQKLRCLYLSAYDNGASPRYGFDLTQIDWVRETLKDMPEGWRILFFSHDAPLPELDPWSEEIRNGNLLLKALDNSKVQILAYIHGHAHADFVYQWQGKQTFPVVSIGCAKCEDMAERKVEGSFTPARVLGEASQELWDILIIKASGKLHFVRFGAGHDRNI
ncbi:MAG: metallophosphoesterase [Selenomonas ruminantium]|nr:metallophosphoesterase [Selenomonas ruminantium]